jgi:proteasome lid subunit RPN8/RPN11
MARRLSTRLSISSRRRERATSTGAYPANEIAGLQAVSDAVIYQHVFANADREVGGVLVGRAAADGGLPLVTGAIPAISADEQRATLTFTQEAWAHVHRVLESQFPPDEQIVGWYHSHPGFGVFLSGHDLFIHENFFSSPSQIAVVVDPHRQMEGVFAWRARELTALFERATPSDWIAAPPAHVQRAPGADPLRRATVKPQQAGYPLLALVIAGVIGVIIGLGLWSLAESGSGTKAPRSNRVARAQGHGAKATTTPDSHIEVLGAE